MNKMQKLLRLIAYSYLGPKDLIKVASLSKIEREHVLSSAIIRDSKRSDFYFECHVYLDDENLPSNHN